MTTPEDYPFHDGSPEARDAALAAARGVYGDTMPRRWAYSQAVGPKVTVDPVFMAAFRRQVLAEAHNDAVRQGVHLVDPPTETVHLQRTVWVDGEPESWPTDDVNEATEARLRWVWDVA